MLIFFYAKTFKIKNCKTRIYYITSTIWPKFMKQYFHFLLDLRIDIKHMYHFHKKFKEEVHGLIHKTIELLVIWRQLLNFQQSQMTSNKVRTCFGFLSFWNPVFSLQSRNTSKLTNHELFHVFKSTDDSSLKALFRCHSMKTGIRQ